MGEMISDSTHVVRYIKKGYFPLISIIEIYIRREQNAAVVRSKISMTLPKTINAVESPAKIEDKVILRIFVFIVHTPEHG